MPNQYQGANQAENADFYGAIKNHGVYFLCTVSDSKIACNDVL